MRAAGFLTTLFAAALALAFATARVIDNQKRDANVIAVCQALRPTSQVFYPPSLPYLATLNRYIGSTTQAPGCVFVPTTSQQISQAIQLIGSKRVPFAVSSGRHASNIGFSTTTGVQIDMKGFQQVTLSGDKSYVDIGSGNIWDNVYQTLEGTGVNIVGGRVTGVGCGGFITGGGGFSWLTNQHGLTSDTLIQADMVLPDGSMVTVTSTQNSDLYWAIRGGGNAFGIVYNWRLRTYPQVPQVYGGLRTYTQDQIPALLQAVAAFSEKNNDAKAQVIPTFNTLAGVPGVSLLGFYDGPQPGDSLQYFNAPSTTAKPFTDGWSVQSFGSLVRSAPSNATSGTRGLFHTVSLQSYSLSILQQIANQSSYWGQQPLRSGTFISYDVEPFLKTWSKSAIDAPYPHSNNPLPLNIYYAWTNPLDDAFYRQAALESARVITNQANAEGQNLDQFTLYPNYALSGTPPSQLFGSANAARLARLKKQYDPNNVMGLTTYFSFT